MPGLHPLAAVAFHGGDAAVRFHEADDPGACAHRAALGGDAVGQPVGYLVSAALQPPGALDKRVIYLGEGVERQRVGGQLHGERCAAQHAPQGGVGDGGEQVFVGRLAEPLVVVVVGLRAGVQGGADVAAHPAQQVGVLLQLFPVLREVGCQRVDKPLVAGGQAVGAPIDDYFGEGLVVEPVPGQVQQSEVAEQFVQRLPFVQSAHEVEAGVQRVAAPAEGLQASADLRVLLQHAHAPAVAGQDVPALQPAQPGSYDGNVVGHV